MDFVPVSLAATMPAFKPNTSFFLLSAWMAFVFIITSSYECNLRAYLMAVDFEPPIDSDADVLRLGRELYFPVGTPLKALYETSPSVVQRALSDKVKAGHV